MEELKDIPLWLLILLALCLITQATWLFVDARKRGSMPWFWGLWGLIQAPMPILLYLLFVRSGWVKRRGRRDKYNSYEGDDEQ